jgi:hypothetical protein
VKILLANSEPSTHGTGQEGAAAAELDAADSRFGRQQGL